MHSEEDLFGSDSEGSDVKHVDHSAAATEPKNSVDDLFGSDDEDGDAKQVVAVSEAAKAMKKKRKSAKISDDEDEDDDGALFGSDDDDMAVEGGNEEESEQIEVTEKERATKSRSELDDLFGDEKAVAAPQVVTKAVPISRLRLPEREVLPEPTMTMAVKMPNFVKIETDEFMQSTFDKLNDADKFGAASAVIRWRYKRDSEGNIITGEDGQPVKESNARLVRLSDGTLKLIVGDSTFNANIHTTEKR
jgi:RNA polymerase-associated protein LEO1